MPRREKKSIQIKIYPLIVNLRFKKDTCLFPRKNKKAWFTVISTPISKSVIYTLFCFWDVHISLFLLSSYVEALYILSYLSNALLNCCCYLKANMEADPIERWRKRLMALQGLPSVSNVADAGSKRVSSTATACIEIDHRKQVQRCYTYFTFELGLYLSLCIFLLSWRANMHLYDI